MADPGFSPRKPTYNFAKFSQKLHENKRIWIWGRGRGGMSKILLCRFVTVSAVWNFHQFISVAGGHASHSRYHRIWSMSGRYASYWNAFLFCVCRPTECLQMYVVSALCKILLNFPKTFNKLKPAYGQAFLTWLWKPGLRTVRARSH